jgi:hypothetical protein
LDLIGYQTAAVVASGTRARSLPAVSGADGMVASEAVACGAGTGR